MASPEGFPGRRRPPSKPSGPSGLQDGRTAARTDRQRQPQRQHQRPFGLAIGTLGWLDRTWRLVLSSVPRLPGLPGWSSGEGSRICQFMALVSSRLVVYDQAPTALILRTADETHDQPSTGPFVHAHVPQARGHWAKGRNLPLHSDPNVRISGASEDTLVLLVFLSSCRTKRPARSRNG